MPFLVFFAFSVNKYEGKFSSYGSQLFNQSLVLSVWYNVRAGKGKTPRGYSTNVIRGRFLPEVQHLTLNFILPFFAKKWYGIFYSRMVPLSHTLFRFLHPF